MKLKIDGASIKQFFLQHGEKVGLGVIGLVVLLLIWSAMAGAVQNTKEVKTPEDLVQAAASAESNIKSKTYPALPIPEVNIDKMLSKSDVNGKFYDTFTPWSPPLNPKEIKREQPKLLPVEDLTLSSVLSVLALKGGPSSPPPASTPPVTPPTTPGSSPITAAPISRTEGHLGEGSPQTTHIVVVKGIIPNARQRAEYATALPKEAGGESLPRDVNYLRVELQRAEVTPTGLSEWTAVQAPDPQLWAPVSGHDPTQAEFVMPIATSVLPPLYYRGWKLGEVSHPDISQKATESSVSAQPIIPGSSEPGSANPASMSPSSPSTPQANHASVGLFRQLDLTAQPGKSYRYRARLIAANPNYNVDLRYLANAELAKAAELATPWSEPSPPVALPSGTTQVLAGKIAVDHGEPKAQLSVLVFEPSTSRLIKAEHGVMLGDVVEFKAKSVALNANAVARAELPTYQFNAGMVLVDLRGGESQTGTGDPSELVFADRQGNLIVADQSRDQRQLAMYGNVLTAPIPVATPPTKAKESKSPFPKVQPRLPGASTSSPRGRR